MLNLFWMRSVARKRQQVIPLTQGRAHCWAGVPRHSAKPREQPCAGPWMCQQLPSLIYKLHRLNTLYLQATDHRFPHHNAPCPQSTDLELSEKK